MENHAIPVPCSEILFQSHHPRNQFSPVEAWVATPRQARRSVRSASRVIPGTSPGQPPDPDIGRIGEQGDDDSGHLAPVVLAQVGRAGNGLPARVGVIDRQDFPMLLTQPDVRPGSVLSDRRCTAFCWPRRCAADGGSERAAHSAQDPAALERIIAPAVRDHGVVKIGRDLQRQHALATSVEPGIRSGHHSGNRGVER